MARRLLLQLHFVRFWERGPARLFICQPRHEWQAIAAWRSRPSA
jgi:hypothetical protein